MPTSARKSSVGGAARRGPQRAHIPYNADDLGHGKKTGYTVTYVEHRSDDFEPFEQVISQADQRTPPRVRTKGGKRKSLAAHEEEVDEDGEMSMDIDDSVPGSPIAYFTNARRPSAMDGRPSLSRPAAPRVSDVDFDKVPSPRPRVPRKSTDRPGPSQLSQTFVPDVDPGRDAVYDDNFGGYDDGGGYDDPGDREDSPEQPTASRRKSFSNLNRTDDEEEEEEAEAALRASSSKKGKEKIQPRTNRRREEPVEDDVEDDIARGLQDIQGDNEDDEEQAEEPEHEEPPPKKSRVANQKKNQENPPQRRRRDVILPPDGVLAEQDPNGPRRGTRHRYKPLDWWRLEKVVYGHPESGVAYVPQIKEIVRIPKDAEAPLGKNGKRKRKGSTAPRSKSRTAENGTERVVEKVVVVPTSNPEEGWDDDTPADAEVVDFVTKEEIKRKVAWTSKMVVHKAAASKDWFFQKIFGDGDFIAAGQLLIPPKSSKPSKQTKDNTYIFYVIEGAVNLKVSNTSIVIATGGMFMVPRGNTYFIENICERNARLFFTQARKVAPSAEEEDAAAREGKGGTSRAPQRSSSVNAVMEIIAAENAEGRKERVPSRAMSART